MNRNQNNKCKFNLINLLFLIVTTWLLSGIVYTFFLPFSNNINNMFNWLMHKESSPTESPAPKLNTPKTPTLNDKEFDEMLERSNRIHHIVEQHVFSLFTILGGIGVLIFTLGGKKWIDEKIDQETKVQYQAKVMSFINEASKLMTLFSWINDEQILSNFTLSIPATNINILQQDLEKILDSIKENFPEDNSLQSFFHVKEGYFCYSAAKLLSREADHKKKIDLKKEAKNYYEQAQKAYERALTEKPENIKIKSFERIFWSQTYCKLANVFTDLANEFTDLAKEFTDLAKEFTELRSYYHNANERYEQSIDVCNNYYWSHHSQGDLFTKQKKYYEAIEKYNEALKIHQTNAETWYMKGTALASLNDHQEAINCYQKALHFTYQKSLILHSFGDLLNKLWRLPKNKSDFNLTREEQNVENEEQKVCNRYQQAFDSDFNQYKSLISWGDTLLKSGYFIDRLYCIKTKKAQNKREKAINKYQQALEMAEGLEYDTSEILYAMGTAYLYNKNYKEACKKYEEAMKRYSPIQQSGWKHPFDKDFRIWFRYDYAIEMFKQFDSHDFYNTKYLTQNVHNNSLNELLEEDWKIFENTFREHKDKNLWEQLDYFRHEDHNLNDEDRRKIVGYLYNRAMLFLFRLDRDTAKKDLKKAQEINPHYLNELLDKDLDWGLFFIDGLSH